MPGGWQPNRKDWDDHQDSVVRGAWGILTPTQIGWLLDRSMDSILGRAGRLGLHVVKGNLWSEEQIEHLCKRWAEGASASIIADELSTPKRTFTRNSVLGKVDRLRLGSRPTQQDNKRQKTERPAKRRHDFIIRKKKPKFTPEPFVGRPEPAREDLVSLQTAIMTGTCTFSAPEWERDACGRDRDISTNSPCYCTEHHHRSRMPFKRMGGQFVLPRTGVQRVA